MSLDEQMRRELDAQRRLRPVDLSALSECVIDPTEYAMAHVLPRGHVTLLGSHGGAGKSVLAATFAAHVATGTAWSGLPTELGRVVFVSLEDPGDLARFRLRRICDTYGLSHSEVTDRMLILDGSSTESVLAVEVASAGTHTLAFTEAMAEIEIAAEGCRLLVIDNASDAYSGNENERQLVRAFIRKLAHIARKHDCAVLLLAHIDKAAARYGSAGNSYSGSTAWHNTVRSRLALIDDEQGIRLVQEKLNLGRKVEPIRLEWTDTGVLVPLPETGTEATERDAQDDAAVLAAIEAAIKDDSVVHTARKGPYSTRSVLADYAELPAALAKDSRRFWATVARLERDARIVRETYRGSGRHARVRFALPDQLRALTPHTPCVEARARVLGSADGCASNAPLLSVAVEAQGAQAVKRQRCDGSGCKWCNKRGTHE